MTKSEKQNIINAPAVGYSSSWGGIEIKFIDYGINDYVEFVAGAFTGKPEAHRVRVHYAGRRDYFICNGYRIYFDEILSA